MASPRASHQAELDGNTRQDSTGVESVWAKKIEEDGAECGSTENIAMDEKDVSDGEDVQPESDLKNTSADEGNIGDLPASFGRYQIVSKLGEGGMGAVYLAKDKQLGRLVALKTPFFEREDDENTVKRFLREAHAAATIKHPNVCPVYDVGQHAGRYYLTMEYVAGCSLAEWIRQAGHDDVKTALEIVAKLAGGLQAAHDCGILHRDLKPGNILINEEDEPFLIDFGMARRFDREETLLTVTGAIAGTPAYMAPEQISGDGDQIGPATDVYALGVILYELLTGSIPFSGNLATMLGSIVANNPIPLRSYRAELDPSVEPICRRAMAKEPGDRYASAGEFADTIRDYLESGTPASAESPQSVVQQSQPEIDEETSSSGYFHRFLRNFVGRSRHSK